MAGFWDRTPLLSRPAGTWRVRYLFPQIGSMVSASPLAGHRCTRSFTCRFSTLRTDHTASVIAELPLQLQTPTGAVSAPYLCSAITGNQISIRRSRYGHCTNPMTQELHENSRNGTSKRDHQRSRSKRVAAPDRDAQNASGAAENDRLSSRAEAFRRCHEAIVSRQKDTPIGFVRISLKRGFDFLTFIPDDAAVDRHYTATATGGL